MKKSQKLKTAEMVELALLSAIVAVLSYFGGFVKIGGLASISLTLIPVVIGAALCGPWAGAWLGGVASVIFFLTPDAAFWLSLSAHGTVITVIVKGILSGLFAGLVYKLLEKLNSTLAVIAGAIVCPIVNTGIFILGCFIFFMDTVKTGAATEGMSIGLYIIIFYVGLNFVFELLTNVILSPSFVRIINIKRKK